MSPTLTPSTRWSSLPNACAGTHVGETINRVKRTAHQLQQALGREATPEEVGSALGISGDKVRRVIDVARQTVSLETPVGNEGDAVLGDFIEDNSNSAPIDSSAASSCSHRSQV